MEQYCGTNKIRTCNARIFNPPLYHWSYSTIVVVSVRFELTSSLKRKVLQTFVPLQLYRDTIMVVTLAGFEPSVLIFERDAT